ncbi:LOW QUALITY PROTEIN: hypothetical protein HID58_055901 [Brassica napus]|uniref:Uncharacterized protein n=1 Tax=Brassica napus TaxID=3708 RepID=A0ABQ8ALT6_BRANA|nr:LOW QUALITY PROTEIN: hypothetical protein HID58_055901 [Brassica napus]
MSHHLWCLQPHKAESPMGSIIAYAPFSLSGREMTEIFLEARGGKLLYSSHPRSSLLSLLPHSNSVLDDDSYSGDAVGPQRFHRLALFQIGRNAGYWDRHCSGDRHCSRNIHCSRDRHRS